MICVCKSSNVVLTLGTSDSGMNGFVYRCNDCKRRGEICGNSLMALETWELQKKQELETIHDATISQTQKP
jgi:hypothetical protein